VFINAAGPWVESVADLTPFNGERVALSPTKGVHLVLPRLTKSNGVFFQAKRDGRMMFVIPWGGYSLVGTTDTDFHGAPDDIRAEPADIEYLLTEARAVLPGVAINESDIITTFAGVRALLRSEKISPSARTREHKIARHGENLLSIAGGKYTTYRAIAEQVVDSVYPILGSPRKRCVTAETSLPQHRPPPSGEKIAESPVVYASDIVHACSHEMAMTVSDMMRRRTSLALSRHGGVETAAVVARMMKPILGWSEARASENLQHYAEERGTALPG
jgi:glycerol-3-phosphate dehydrogenase